MGARAESDGGMSGLLDTLYAERERRQAEEDTERLSQSLVSFVREAFPVIKPTREYRHNWHIDAICEHLEAVSNGDIKQLQVWIPPGTMKPVDTNAWVLMGDGTRKRLGDVQVDDIVITHRGRPR